MWILIWIVSIGLAWAIGNSRASPVGGFLLGLFLGPLGVIAAFALVDNRNRPCPFCKKLISREAVKCPHCQSEVTPETGSKIVDKKTAPALDEGTKKCPFCAETIKQEAVVCRFCNRDVPPPALWRRAPLNFAEGLM